MLIFPAIDLRNGQCVRLLHGDPNAQTTYGDDPPGVAEQFAEQGAEWLHVINLDGAFGAAAAAAQNLEAIQSILDRVDIPIQVGGGVRAIDDIERLLSMGVTRVILGTMAVERPRQLLDVIARFGAGQITVSLDVKAGKVATHGWRSTSTATPLDLGRQLRSLGVTHAIYTDIGRDGALTGLNVDACQTLARETGLKVIASGGVAGLDDIRRAAAAPLAGVIIGRALYTGALTLPQALEAARS
ncbi:MAG: 1-(5-phosphoribosyl)-5-[(5-phosphoribosylamino)methylideneamino]imidazole-4-carboxamide isomerase [Anaerolineae bacterium]